MTVDVAADIRSRSFVSHRVSAVWSVLISVATVSILIMSALSGFAGEVKLITLDPGHFHAALVQKSMYPQVSPEVHVYAPVGPDLDLHLGRINDFNSRTENP